MIDILIKTYAVILPVLIAMAINLLRQQKKEREASAKGLMLLLRVQLIEYHEYYMQKGEIPSYAYENFKDMFEAYRNLGGNGMIKKMNDEIDELNLKRKVD